MTEATPFLSKYDITFLRPPAIAQRAFFEHYYNINAVPPCSLKAFIDSIADIPELCELKKLLKKALDKNKWVIHYGI